MDMHHIDARWIRLLLCGHTCLLDTLCVLVCPIQPQQCIPDVVVWMLAGRKRVACTRIPAHKLFYSDGKGRGQLCSKVQTLFLTVCDRSGSRASLPLLSPSHPSPPHLPFLVLPPSPSFLPPPSSPSSISLSLSLPSSSLRQ